MSFHFLFACTLFSSEVPVLKPPEIDPKIINKTLVLQLVNDARKKGRRCGDTFYAAAPAVTWNNELEKAAFAHSNDMFQNNFFSHKSKNGQSAGQRITSAGYNWTTFGENIAQGHSTEKEVVDGWLNSPGHCVNIMTSTFNEMGVAKSGSYWTQTFASK